MIRPQLLLRFVAADLRRSWTRFLFVILAFAAGVGILAAVSGLQRNVVATIAQEAKSLLAADLSINSSAPLPPEITAVIPATAQSAQEITFASMLSVRAGEVSRLVQVRALSGAFPFYGSAVIEPAEAFSAIQSGTDPQALLLDRSLAQQLELRTGDQVTIGRIPFVVRGVIEQFPGESYARTVIAPKVFVPYASISDSELLQRGSRVTYKRYVALENPSALATLEGELKRLQPKYRYELETVERRKETIGRVLGNVNRFLTLISFAAVLLGGLGVSSAMVTFIRARLPVIASLRCIGATRSEVTLLYLSQGIVVALIGAVAGAIAGVGISYLLPAVLSEFLPLAVVPVLSWSVLGQGFLIAIAVGGFFCLWPLLGIFRISPAAAIRGGGESFSGDSSSVWSIRRERILLISIGIFLLVATASALLESLKFGALAAAALLLVCGLLGALALLCGYLVRRWRPERAPFVIRYGLTGLGRPQSQTGIVMVTLGLASFLISTIYLTRTSVLDQVSVAGSGNRPNLVLFDVQSDQRPGVRALIERNGLTVQQEVPIVTMRLMEINGRDNLALRDDKDIPDWTLRREYRSSYREQLIESEQLTSGRFVSSFSWSGDPAQVVPVTVEEGIAKDLKVSVGDRVRFDVQGVPILTEIVGIRRVDWRRVQTNFFFLFPAGVLESAPQFYALMTRADSSESLAKVQRELLTNFGNVSAIDLNLILETADIVLSKVAAAVQFLAIFTVLSGIFVLAGALATTRAARLRELLLLKVVGATARQSATITLIEFLLLGTLSAAIGIGASLVGGWVIATWYFEATFAIPWRELAIIYVTVLLAVLGVGLAMTWGLLRVSPIEILRTSQT